MFARVSHLLIFPRNGECLRSSNFRRSDFKQNSSLKWNQVLKWIHIRQKTICQKASELYNYKNRYSCPHIAAWLFVFVMVPVVKWTWKLFALWPFKWKLWNSIFLFDCTRWPVLSVDEITVSVAMFVSTFWACEWFKFDRSDMWAAEQKFPMDFANQCCLKFVFRYIEQRVHTYVPLLSPSVHSSFQRSSLCKFWKPLGLADSFSLAPL